MILNRRAILGASAAAAIPRYGFAQKPTIRIGVLNEAIDRGVAEQQQVAVAVVAGRGARVMVFFDGVVMRILGDVIAGAADPEESAALLGPVAGLDEVVDYRVNPFGPGRSSPRSFAAIFSISTSVSSCRIRFFALNNSALSGVVIPCRSPRSIWSWRTQLCSAPALTPSWTAAVVMGFPARTRAAARRRNSAGNGRGMDEASQKKARSSHCFG